MKQILIIPFLCSIISINAQEIKIDTLNVIDSLTIMKVDLTPAQLKIKRLDLDTIVLKIYYNKNGSIQNEFESANPVENEITFFYALNYEKEEMEMHFIFDKKLEKIYSKKNFEQLLEIVKILEYGVFTTDSFSGTSAYSALEKSL